MEIDDPSLLVLTNSEMVLVDTHMLPELSDYKWCPNNGYAMCTKKGVGSLHRFVNKTPKGKHTDHVNRLPYDNRKSNLRTVERCENRWNSSKHKRQCASKYKGVLFRKDRGSWRAVIVVDGKCLELGNFRKERDAALAYNRAAIKFRGAFAVLNDLSE